MLEPSVCCAFPELRSGDEIFTKHCLYLSININLPVAMQSWVAVWVIKRTVPVSRWRWRLRETCKSIQVWGDAVWRNFITFRCMWLKLTEQSAQQICFQIPNV